MNSPSNPDPRRGYPWGLLACCGFALVCPLVVCLGFVPRYGEFLSDSATMITPLTVSLVRGCGRLASSWTLAAALAAVLLALPAALLRFSPNDRAASAAAMLFVLICNAATAVVAVILCLPRRG
jgi:hypothetical protein